jgi:hypothetical protein
MKSDALMKVTTTTSKKDIVKQIIIDGEIKRFTAEETIHQHGIKCEKAVITRMTSLVIIASLFFV